MTTRIETFRPIPSAVVLCLLVINCGDFGQDDTGDGYLHAGDEDVRWSCSGGEPTCEHAFFVFGGIEAPPCLIVTCYNSDGYGTINPTNVWMQHAASRWEVHVTCGYGGRVLVR